MVTMSTGRSRRILLAVTFMCTAAAAGPELAAAQGVGAPGDLRPPDERRVHWGIAAGPALEVATPGEREGERGILVVPWVGVRVASWFEYVAEAHVARYVTPMEGTIAGIAPIGWRIHGRGRMQPYVSMGAGVAWTDFTGLRGIDRRRNYLTHIGAGVRRAGASGSAVSVEARLFHLSNLSSAPPNLGMEVFTVMVGYRPGALRRRVP